MTAAMSHQEQQTSITDNDTKPESASTIGSSVAQDVGLIFVREYYTFLSKKPERLHAFYAKDSLYLRGDEGAYVSTCCGQNAIQSKIEELGFEDCKVLVTQVDSQPSANDGIILQVIGEMRNRNELSQKFCQTVFLARQKNGYHVLNDVFRFLRESVMTSHNAYEKEISTPAREDPPSLPTKQQQLRDEIGDGIQNKENDENDLENESMSNSSKNAASAVAQPATTPADVARRSQSAEESGALGTIKINENNDSVAERRTQAKDQDDESFRKTTAATVSIKESGENIQDAKTASYLSSPEKQPEKQQQEQPGAPKTWADLAADRSEKWGTHVAETKGTMAVAPGHPSAKFQQPPPSQQQSEATSASHNQITTTPNVQAHTHNQGNRDQRRGEEGTQIFVKGVTQHIQEDHLREAFAKFGTVKAITVMHNRNCAFLDFTTADAVRRALHQHKVHTGSHVVLAEERRPGGGGSGGRHQHNRQQQQNGRPNERRFQQDGGGHRRGGGGAPRSGKSRGIGSNSSHK